jgi:O-antigen ligase
MAIGSLLHKLKEILRVLLASIKLLTPTFTRCLSSYEPQKLKDTYWLLPASIKLPNPMFFPLLFIFTFMFISMLSANDEFSSAMPNPTKSD